MQPESGNSAMHSALYRSAAGPATCGRLVRQLDGSLSYKRSSVHPRRHRYGLESGADGIDAHGPAAGTDERDRQQIEFRCWEFRSPHGRRGYIDPDAITGAALGQPAASLMNADQTTAPVPGWRSTDALDFQLISRDSHSMMIDNGAIIHVDNPDQCANQCVPDRRQWYRPTQVDGGESACPWWQTPVSGVGIRHSGGPLATASSASAWCPGADPVPPVNAATNERPVRRCWKTLVKSDSVISSAAASALLHCITQT